MSSEIPQRRQHGLSMVELMVAITISLLLLAGVIQIFVASRQTYTLQDGMSRLQENARYALGRISQDISSTGYLGCMDSSDTDYIENNLTDQANGYDFANPISAGDNTGVDGTDILTVRFGSSGGIPVTANHQGTESEINVDATHANYEQIERFDIIVLGNCDGAGVFMVTNDPEGSGGVIQFQGGITATSGPNIGQSNDGDPGSVPLFVDLGSYGTVFRASTSTYLVDASTSGTGNALFVNSATANNELIQGVEDFQVTFGVDDDTDLGADRYVDGNNLVAADWNNVVSVRMDLRLNTVDPVQAGNTIAKNFTTTVRLRNRGNVVNN